MEPVVVERPLLELMTAHEMISELRATPNPATGKRSHSLSEISKLAGASPAWSNYMLAKPPETKTRGTSPFTLQLRRYLKSVREDQSVLLDRIRERGKIAATSMPPETGPQTFPVAPAPQPEAPRRRAEAAVPAPVVKTPAQEVPHIPVTKTLVFIEKWDVIRARVWAEIVELDGLLQITPTPFKPVVETLRDELMALSQRYED